MKSKPDHPNIVSDKNLAKTLANILKSSIFEERSYSIQVTYNQTDMMEASYSGMPIVKLSKKYSCQKS